MANIEKPHLEALMKNAALKQIQEYEEQIEKAASKGESELVCCGDLMEGARRHFISMGFEIQEGANANIIKW